MIVNAMDYIVNPLITNFEHLSRHDSDSLGQIKNLSMKTRSDCFIITAFHIMGLEKPQQKKTANLVQLTQMWVDGVGWSQTFINQCYGIFDPFFVKTFR